MADPRINYKGVTMIKFIQCIKRRPDLSVESFRSRWIEYQEEARRLAGELGAARVEFSTTLVVRENIQIVFTRGTMPPYDGMVEVVWPEATDIRALFSEESLAGKAEKLRAMQVEFIDLESSAFFFAIGE
jgi:hypothetical protein